ncbi:MAG: hypothetical protein WCC64_14185 [Aliidongia sp.]
MSRPLTAGRAALIFGLALAFSVLPIFSTVLPPILDYPNHLARMHILAANGASALLDQFYLIAWAPLPNLAMDLIVPPLSRLMPLDLAGKLFLVLVLAVLAGGAATLNRVLHGRWTLWSFSVFIMLYNRILMWGFLNYLFGLGLALFAAALWLAEEAAPVWRRILLSSLFALATYFSHIAAFGVYALILVGSEAGPIFGLLSHRQWRPLTKRLSIAGAQFVLPAVFVLAGWGRSAGGKIEFGSPWRKIDLLFSVFDSSDRLFELVCFALFVGVLLMLTIRGRLGLAPAMRWPLVLVTTAYLALPSQLMSGFGADRRMAIVIFLVILAGSLPRLDGLWTARFVGTAFLALFVARLGLFEMRWLEADGVYRRDLAALDMIPQGAKLAVLWPGTAVQVGKDPELHLPNLAIARRDAFVPTLFAFPTQQPVALTPTYAALAQATDGDALWQDLVTQPKRPPPALLDVIKSYDFIAFIDLKPIAVPANPCLAPIAPGTTFQLFAIDRNCAAWS